MGVASDDNEVRRLRYAFAKQGLRLRVQRATTYEDHLRDELRWTISKNGAVVQRDVPLTSLRFMECSLVRSRMQL